jgi:LuxR family quorum-sensing system transcriptional regulator CciR
LECVVLIARGKTDWEIAKILGLSEETVADHVNEARRRYEVSRRAELGIHALYNGDLTFNDIIH